MALHSLKHSLLLALLLGVALGCNSKLTSQGGLSKDASNEASVASLVDSTETETETPPSTTSQQTGISNPKSTGYTIWKKHIQPLIATQCASCHLGERFGYASLVRQGSTFSEEESAKNYQRFLTMISLDAPKKSRLLAKVLPASDPDAIAHAGKLVLPKNGTPFNLLLAWIESEKSARCPDCGITAKRSYVAYIKQPSSFWSVTRLLPTRDDWGTRKNARIMMQPMHPNVPLPSGSPIDFLASSGFCADGDCDFGHLAVNHAGTQMAFECRVPVAGEKWLDRSWNICVAEISPEGTAVNPRFLLPPEKRNAGYTFARTSPFMLACHNRTAWGSCTDVRPDPNGSAFAVKGVWDNHARYRRRNDLTPTYSADDDRIYFSSQKPDPRTGEDTMQTYHGSEHLANIVSVRTDGTEMRTIYRNDGGSADFPFLLKDGNVAFHTWNLDRMDRHLYQQSTADGMTELPVLFGRVQGPSQWGKATQLTNGLIFGITGARRGSAEQFVPFAADHTLGTGLDSSQVPFKILPQSLLNELTSWPNSYCLAPPNGINCSLSQFFADANWFPDGRALLAHNTSRTYVGTDHEDGEAFYRSYNPHGLGNYLPKNFGISLMNARGQVQVLIPNEPGAILRYPVWVGKRQSPKIQTPVTDEGLDSSILHVADFRVWLSFPFQSQDKRSLMSTLDKIKSVRVLYKETAANACLSDQVRTFMNNGGTGEGDTGDHPTALGINNATGFVRFQVPTAQGGNGFGDIDLASDGSVNLKVPAGKLLLFQGIDSDGFAVAQRTRLLALPPGHTVNTSVKRAQYQSQCIACHGSLTASPFVPLSEFGKLPTQPMDFNTASSTNAPIDLTSPSVSRQTLTFQKAIRPILDAKCVSCHSGANPAAQLNLQSQYSPTGNAPQGLWTSVVTSRYLNHLSAAAKVPSTSGSVPFSWALSRDDGPYSTYYSTTQNHQPLADQSPWDTGYQNLFRPASGGKYYYLNQTAQTNLGRGDAGNDGLGLIASKSYLIEVLSGTNLDTSKAYAGSYSHAGLLSLAELRTFMSVLDLGFPYMARCDDKVMTSGPYAGQPWGDPEVKKVE